MRNTKLWHGLQIHADIILNFSINFLPFLYKSPEYLSAKGYKINKLFLFTSENIGVFYRKGRKGFAKGAMPLRSLRNLCVPCGKILQPKVESL
jgi:hypothetical protein